MGGCASALAITSGPWVVRCYDEPHRYAMYQLEKYEIMGKYRADKTEAKKLHENDSEALERATKKIKQERDEAMKKVWVYFGRPTRDTKDVGCRHGLEIGHVCRSMKYDAAFFNHKARLDSEARWQAAMPDWHPLKILSSADLKNPDVLTDKHGVNRAVISRLRKHI